MKMQHSKTGRTHMKLAGGKQNMPSVGRKFGKSNSAPKKKAMKTGYKAR